ADGQTLATLDDRGTVRLWKSTTGELLRRFTDPKVKPDTPVGGPPTLAFAPDGKRLLLNHSKSPSPSLWDTTTGKELRRFEGRAAQFAPDGKTVAVVRGGADVEIGLQDATGKEVGVLLGPKGTLSTFAFSPDGKTLTAAIPGQKGGSLYVWDLAT